MDNTMEKTRVNYTDVETQDMVEKYLKNPNTDTVEMLAEMLGRSKKSIIGKLSREGVYRREGYKTKTGEAPITKAEIVGNISEALGVEISDLEGLEKAPKKALKTIETIVCQRD